MTKRKSLDGYQPGRGYSKEDWDDVSDPHETTPEQAAQAKPFAEALPGLAESIKRARGRPALPEALEPVTIRLPPSTISRYKAKGEDWRARMAKTLIASEG